MSSNQMGAAPHKAGCWGRNGLFSNSANTVKSMRRNSSTVRWVDKAYFVIFAAALTLGWQTSARADDQDIIDFRQLIMKQLDAEAAALGMMASGQIPPDSLALEAKSVANGAKAALKAFEPRVPGGEAKPEVWSQWDDFSKRLQAFARDSEEMAKVAESGNLAKVTELMVTALPCKQCHDVYRNKKK
jgi:cytochrome c556